MRKYETLEQFWALVDNYFYEHEVPTFAGLARALGLSTKQLIALADTESAYQDKTIEAFTRIEEFAETAIYDKGSATGAKFVLMNRFGWNEKSEVKEDTNFVVSWADSPTGEQKLLEGTNT